MGASCTGVKYTESTEFGEYGGDLTNASGSNLTSMMRWDRREDFFRPPDRSM